ncbi:hypothetical protein GCK72_017889 [Caenorhabditis remanei]|uniref:Lin-15A/B-like domain-containing protein n=1 Tax=Caenorhabditis remanei TaxID=31234 RepID=A0A6A5G9N4_CAERE|nr:hypothetical protein GCK72_017889 [Caenorhabditis remanei]KAF1751335.1 hypothetical protein GCK72_017889 [Caenorhabditis remanei]
MNEETTHEFQWEEENVDNYDAPLHNLVIDFFEDVGLPFATVENPKFQELIKYLNPVVTPPTINSIMYTATNTHELEAIPVSDNEVVVVPPLNLAEFPSTVDIVKYLNGITISGGTSYVCIVCLKKNDWSKVRRLDRNENLIFLYVCVAVGLYSLDIAQKMYTMPKPLRCCSDHYSHVVEALMKKLNVTTVDDIVTCNEKQVTDSYLIWKKIKNPDFMENQQSQKEILSGLGSFRYTLRCFSKKHFLPPVDMQGFHMPRESNETVSEFLSDQNSPPKVRRVEQSGIYGNPRPGEETFPDDFLVTD